MSELNPKKGFFGEIFNILKETKKYWLLPIIVFALLAAAIVILSVSGTSSFVYSLF